MPLIGIEFDVEDPHARADDYGRVTESGKYYREEHFSERMYKSILHKAERDPDANVTKLKVNP
ncbi:MAG: hypothetical protein ABEH81_00890 [Halopenitus sp.]